MALGRHSQRKQFSQFNPLSFEELSAIPMYKTQQAMKVYEGASILGDIKIDDGLNEYDKQSANKIKNEIDSNVNTIQQGIMTGELDPIQGANAIFDLKNKIKGFGNEIDRLNSLKPSYSAFNEEGRKGVMAGHITSDDFNIGMEMALKRYNSTEGGSFSPGPYTASFDSNEVRDDIMKMRPIILKQKGYKLNPNTGEYTDASGEIVTLSYRELLPQAQLMVGNNPQFKAMVNRDIEHYMLNNQKEDGTILLEVTGEDGEKIEKTFTDVSEFRDAFYKQKLNQYALEVASLAITQESTMDVDLSSLSGNGGKTTSLVDMSDPVSQEAWENYAKDENIQGYSITYNGQPVDKEAAVRIYVQNLKDQVKESGRVTSPAYAHFFEVERKENGEPVYKNGRSIYTGEFKTDPKGEIDYEADFVKSKMSELNAITTKGSRGTSHELETLGFEFNELHPDDPGYEVSDNEALNDWTNHINETQAKIQTQTGKNVGDVVTNKTVAEIAARASKQEEDNEVTIVKNYLPYQQSHAGLIDALVRQKNMAVLMSKSFSYQEDGVNYTTIKNDKRSIAKFGKVEKVTYEGGIRDGIHQGDAVFSITNDVGNVFKIMVNPESPDLQAVEAPYANATTRYYNNSPSIVNSELKESYTPKEMKDLVGNENVPGLQESYFVVPGNKKDEEYHFQVLWQKRPYTIDEKTGEMQVGWNQVGKFYIEQFNPATGEPMWIPYEDMTVYEPDHIYTTMDALRLEMKKSEDEIEDGYVIPGVPNI